MKIKTIILLFLVTGSFYIVKAQSMQGNNGPKKGDFTVSATIGYNSYTSIAAPSGLLANYELQALSTNWAEKKLMVGLEGGWFFNNIWKLNLGGGLSFTKNPGYSEKPGTVGPNFIPGDGSIPNYRAVGDGYFFNYNIYTGVDRYFKFKGLPENLYFYAGGRLGAAYGLNQVFYDEFETLGKSSAETLNLRVSGTCGLDYYISAMYIGIQVDALSYTYNLTSYKPQEGLSNLSADRHNVGFLAAPTIKIGFKF